MKKCYQQTGNFLAKNKGPLVLSNNSGAVMIVSLMAIASLILIATGFMTMVLTEKKNSERSTGDIFAFNLAEAGVEKAIWELDYPTSQWASPWTTSGTTRTLTNQTLTGVSGAYDVSVNLVSPNEPVIEATGTAYVPNTSPVKVLATRKVRVIMEEVEEEGPEKAIISDGHIDFNLRSCTDSYDSRVAPYDENNPGHDGDVSTNSITNSDVDIAGDVVIDGKVFTGQGSNPLSVVNKNASAVITGALDDLAVNEVYTPVVIPSGLPAQSSIIIGADSSATINGDGQYTSITIGTRSTLTFTNDATLYVTNEFDLSADTQVILANPNIKVTIYVADNFNVGTAARVNEGGDPSKFKVKATDDYTGTLANGLYLYEDSQFYGTIESNNAEVTLSTDADVFGAIKAQTVYMRTDACVHYDVALRDGTPPGGPKFLLTSWQEK